MSDIHIDDFYKDAGEILQRLYGSFPRKTTLYVEDIAGPANHDEFGLPCERYVACFSTMLWLADHGYLQFESTIHQDAIDQAVLTHKSFMILSSRSNYITNDVGKELANNTNPDEESKTELPASVLESTRTNIHQLRQALKSRSSNQIKACLRELLSHELNFR